MNTIIKKDSEFTDIAKIAKLVVKQLGKTKALEFAKRCSLARVKSKCKRAYNLGDLACQIRNLVL